MHCVSRGLFYLFGLDILSTGVLGMDGRQATAYPIVRWSPCSPVSQSRPIHSASVGHHRSWSDAHSHSKKGLNPNLETWNTTTPLLTLLSLAFSLPHSDSAAAASPLLSVGPSATCHQNGEQACLSSSSSSFDGS
jgi:hypothetical protein